MSEFSELTGLEIRMVANSTAANVRLAYYGRQYNQVPHTMVALPGWKRVPDTDRSTANEFAVRAPWRWIYGGVAAATADQEGFKFGSCAATYHLNGEYLDDLKVRQLSAQGLSASEITRLFQFISRGWKHGHDEAYQEALRQDANLRKFMALDKSNSAQFPATGACARSDYFQRWRKIIDACFVEILGMSHGAIVPRGSERTDALENIIRGQKYRSGYSDILDRYWRLYLPIVYSMKISSNMNLADARAIALREIRFHRPKFDAEEDKRPVACTAVPWEAHGPGS